jgi:hypothetical protein
VGSNPTPSAKHRRNKMACMGAEQPSEEKVEKAFKDVMQCLYDKHNKRE